MTGPCLIVRIKMGSRSPFGDLSTAWVVDPKSGEKIACIKPQDKLKNASGIRRFLSPAPEPVLIPENADPIPPLLKQILSDYAVTGLPPAYIPKEGKSDEQ